MSEKSDWEQGYDQAQRRFYEERKILTARITELKEFIDQLIEVSEKMFTAVIAAADPYDEGMREWDKIVNDWKEG